MKTREMRRERNSKEEARNIRGRKKRRRERVRGGGEKEENESKYN
jgi:hypothetical protein